jgi:hypothetical protein
MIVAMGVRDFENDRSRDEKRSDAVFSEVGFDVKLQPVGSRLMRTGKRDAPVGIRLLAGHQCPLTLGLLLEFDGDALGGISETGVEDVRADHAACELKSDAAKGEALNRRLDLCSLLKTAHASTHQLLSEWKKDRDRGIPSR